MTAINKELYDALVAAGAPEDKASAAAATVWPSGLAVADLTTKADLEALRAATKADLQELRLATKADIAALKADVRGWMLAQTLLLIAAMVGLKLFG